jgi:hypothetical protein
VGAEELLQSYHFSLEVKRDSPVERATANKKVLDQLGQLPRTYLLHLKTTVTFQWMLAWRENSTLLKAWKIWRQ